MKIEISLPSMGIGAVIAAAVILTPFFILELTEPEYVPSPQPIRGIPSEAALEPPPPKPTAALLLENASPPLGDPNAPVTLVEFGDYQCGFCHRYYAQTEPSIVSEYVDKGLVKMYFKDYIVIGPDSVTAAQGAHCANDQGMYWQFHDAIYDNYGGERSGWASSSGIAQIATTVDGLDEDQWTGCMERSDHVNTVNASSQDARDLGLTGTPAFFVIGQDGEVVLLRGAKQFAEFMTVIDSVIPS